MLSTRVKAFFCTGFLLISLARSQSGIVYTAIQIYVSSEGVKTIDTLRLSIYTDTTVRAHALRGDGSGIWDDVPVGWVNNTGFHFSINAPASASSWKLQPIDTGQGGVIYAHYPSGDTILRDTIYVIGFPVDCPLRMVLYPLQGIPGPDNQPLPPSVTISAGDSFQMTAKIFDLSNVWLSSYEQTDSLITWTITEARGSGSIGSLDTNKGFTTIFTPTRAYSIVTIIATFQDRGIRLSDSITVFIKPCCPVYIDLFQIVTHDSTVIDSLTMMTDMDMTVRLQVTRYDAFGNFIQKNYREADWSISNNLKTGSIAPQAANSWTFTPLDTGSGFIIASINGVGVDTIRITIFQKPSVVNWSHFLRDPSSFSGSEHLQINVYDILGKHLYQGSIGSNKFSLRHAVRTPTKSGIYVVMLRDKRMQETKTVTIPK